MAISGCHITTSAACICNKAMKLLICTVCAEPKGMWALQCSALQPAMLQGYSGFIPKRKGVLRIGGAIASVTAVGFVALTAQDVVQFGEIPHPGGFIPRTNSQASLLTFCKPSLFELCAPQVREATRPAIRCTKAQRLLHFRRPSCSTVLITRYQRGVLD